MFLTDFLYICLSWPKKPAVWAAPPREAGCIMRRATVSWCCPPHVSLASDFYLDAFLGLAGPEQSYHPSTQCWQPKDPKVARQPGLVILLAKPGQVASAISVHHCNRLTQAEPISWAINIRALSCQEKYHQIITCYRTIILDNRRNCRRIFCRVSPSLCPDPRGCFAGDVARNRPCSQQSLASEDAASMWQ